MRADQARGLNSFRILTCLLTPQQHQKNSCVACYASVYLALLRSQNPAPNFRMLLNPRSLRQCYRCFIAASIRQFVESAPIIVVHVVREYRFRQCRRAMYTRHLSVYGLENIRRWRLMFPVIVG